MSDTPLRFPFPILTILGCSMALLAPALSLAGDVRGVVLDPDGRPAPGARVLVTGPAAISVATATDARGTFHLTSLAGGTYRLQALLEGFRADPVSVVLAQDEDLEVSIRLQLSALTESVVVSARQVDLPLSRTSGSVTVVTATELASRQIETVAQALALVPGLTVSASGGRGGLVSVLPRGGESNFTLVLVDGIKLNAFGGGFDFAHLQTTNIERIEVVRGPQSALYGADAIGAVVQIVTRHGGPTRVDGLAEGGSFGTGRLAFSSSGSLGSRRAWEWGAAAERLATDGFTGLAPGTGDRVTNDDYRNRTVSLSGGWRAARTRVRSNLRLTSSERGFPGPFGSDPGGTFGGIDRISRGRTENALWSLGVTQAWSQRVRQQVDVTVADLDGAFTSPFGPSTSETRRVSGRLQTDLDVRRGVGVTVGAELQRERARSTFITGLDSQQIPIGRYVVGYFGEARLDPHRRWLVTAGLRVEQIHRDALEADPSAFAPRPPFEADTVVSANPKLSVAYFPRPPDGGARSWTRVGASAGTGIRAPDAFEIAFTDNPRLKPERSRSVSAGVQQTLLGGALVLDATGFYNDYDDLIVSLGPTLSDLSRFRTDNIANARSHGVEITGAVRSAWGLEARAAYTRLDTRVLEVDRSGGQAPPPFSVGDPLIRRPRHQGSVDLAITRDRISGFLQLVSHGQRLDVDPSFGASGGSFTAPGHALVRVGLAGRIGDRLELYTRVTNLLDRRHEDALGFPGLGRGVIAGVRIAPRQ